jgi:hypothetical protein
LPNKASSKFNIAKGMRTAGWRGRTRLYSVSQALYRAASTSIECLEAQAGSLTMIVGSLSSCIAGFHQSCRFSQSSGPRRSCVGIGPAFAATGVGSRTHWEGDRRSTRSCAD